MDAMPADLARYLVQEAQAGAPNEVCGFILRGWHYLPITNISGNPRRTFVMEPLEMMEVLRSVAEEVLGVYHSHPGGSPRPSDTDIEAWRYPQFRYWIVTYRDAYEWRIADDRAQPVRRDGTTGPDDMAYPLLAPAATL